MNFRKYDKGRARASVMGLALLLCAALGADPALSQTPTDATRDATEHRRAQEREAQERERLTRQPDVRLPLPAEASGGALPTNEAPCFVIHQVSLRGDEADHFGWLLDHLNGPDGSDAPLRKCLGAAGIGVVIQRAQDALLERGYVTSRALAEPQDLSGGALALTVVPGRIRHVRFAEPASDRVTAWNAVPARPGDILNLRDVEQALENFKRVPTAEADIEIVPAAQPGESDLLIRWTQRLPLRLNLSVDDSGARSTGRYQGSVTFSVDSPFGLNDLLYVGVQGDLGGGDPGRRGTNGHSLHYSLPWGNQLLALSLSAPVPLALMRTSPAAATVLLRPVSAVSVDTKVCLQQSSITPSPLRRSCSTP